MTLILTPNAQKAVERFISSSEKSYGGLRISVDTGGCSGFQYAMALEEEPGSEDVVVPCGPTNIYIDATSAPYLKGTTVDFVESIEESGFKFENPNAAATCACGKSFGC